MIKYFVLPTADIMAARELEEAKRELLRSQTALDYANRIVQYHEDRIKRLTEYLNG